MTQPQPKKSVKKSSGKVEKSPIVFNTPFWILLGMVVIALMIMGIDEFIDYREKQTQQEWTFHYNISNISDQRYLNFLREKDSTARTQLYTEYLAYKDSLKRGLIEK